MKISAWSFFTGLVIMAAVAVAGSSVVHVLGEPHPASDLVDVR